MGIVRKVLSDIIINIVEHKYRTRSINETKVGTKPSMTIKYDETGYGYKVHPRGETPLRLPWYRVSSLSKEVSDNGLPVFTSKNQSQSKNFLISEEFLTEKGNVGVKPQSGKEVQ